MGGEGCQKTMDRLFVCKKGDNTVLRHAERGIYTLKRRSVPQIYIKRLDAQLPIHTVLKKLGCLCPDADS